MLRLYNLRLASKDEELPDLFDLREIAIFCNDVELHDDPNLSVIVRNIIDGILFDFVVNNYPLNLLANKILTKMTNSQRRLYMQSSLTAFCEKIIWPKITFSEQIKRVTYTVSYKNCHIHPLFQTPVTMLEFGKELPTGKINLIHWTSEK